MATLSPEIQIAAGVIMKWLPNKRIRIYTLQTLDCQAIDGWVTHVLTGLADCAATENYRVIYDFSTISLFALHSYWAYTFGSLGMTLDGIERTHQLLKTHRAHLAIFTHPTLSAWLLKNIHHAEVDVPFKVFFVLEQAVAWLDKE